MGQGRSTGGVKCAEHCRRLESKHAVPSYLCESTGRMIPLEPLFRNPHLETIAAPHQAGLGQEALFTLLETVPDLKKSLMDATGR